VQRGIGAPDVYQRLDAPRTTYAIDGHDRIAADETERPLVHHEERCGRAVTWPLMGRRAIAMKIAGLVARGHCRAAPAGAASCFGRGHSRAPVGVGGRRYASAYPVENVTQAVADAPF
jgi:hypothetical protein